MLPPTWPHDASSLRDEPAPREVTESSLAFRGRVWDIATETVELGDGQSVTRDFVKHTSAVGVLALDDQDRVLLIRQYRHPVGQMLWEPVAGLLDVPGEDAQIGAARELVEEAGLVAGRWDVLVDYLSSPGGSSETLRCFLARDLAPAPGGRPPGEGEERDLPIAWVPLEAAVEHVLAGRFAAPITALGVLAAYAARQGDWKSLRPVTSPWQGLATVEAMGRRRSASEA